MFDKFVDALAATVAARARKLIPRAAPAASDARHAGRRCSYPGCPNPGNGPRFRWFCVDHAKSVPVAEQKRILAARAAKGAGKVARAKGRGPSKLRGRKIDMRCRVAGCKNVSKGPRFGFICAEHLKKLSERELNLARERWRAARRNAA
jgi:hypothetical protein